MAIDRTGYLELIESLDPEASEGFRNIHFKVQDIEAAIAELRSRGLRVVWNLRAGRMREAVFEAESLHAMRLCLVEYDAPSLVEAVLSEPVAAAETQG